jgi:glycosyltransferase involved in cell wall biosynthesis
MPSTKPTVLELCLTLDTGGLERVVVNLSNELSRIGAVSPRICTVGQTTGNVIPATIRSDIDWTELKGKPCFTLKTALKLTKLVRQKKISLIHAHGTQPLVYALTASMMCGTPIVFTKHNSYDDLDFFQRHRVFQMIACHTVRQFIGVSDQATEMLRRVFKPAALRCQTLINGTELPEKLARKDCGEFHGYSANDKFVMVTVCRLAPEKDIVTLLWAFASVHGTAPNTELWIVGDGGERRNLVQLAENLGIKDSVRFWGFRGKVDQILTCADLFVNSSWTEGISISILEAMSLGLPIVATSVGGTPTIVKDEVNGLLVEPRSPHQLGSAMLRLVQDRALCRKFGASSREQVERHWSLRRMTERYLEIYWDALGMEAPLRIPEDTVPNTKAS